MRKHNRDYKKDEDKGCLTFIELEKLDTSVKELNWVKVNGSINMDKRGIGHSIETECKDNRSDHKVEER